MKNKIKSKKKEDLTDEEKEMLDAYDNPVDFTNKKYIEKLIDYVNS
ncbi:hypothetical protein FHU25_002170 [Clostridium saccharobutylicum]|nr:hypothetical protein [Clostridium saccharobutylicum]